MDFKYKYFKYKDKYLKLKLKKQIGGGNIKIIKMSDNQEIIINDRAISSQIEIFVNKVEKKMTNGLELGNFLFNFTDNSEIKLNDNDFNIINIIFKKITISLTPEEENFLNELLGIKKVTTVAEKEKVDTTLFFKYEYINPIPDSLIVTEIDTLFSLLFSLDKYQLFSSNRTVAYYMPTPKLIENRLDFLYNYGIPNPISVFNKEKKKEMDTFNLLKKIYLSFETLFIKSLTIDYSKSNEHKNTGIIILDGNPYFYKKLNTLSDSTVDANSILKNYTFIKNCYNFDIDNEYTYKDNRYNLHFVKVPLKVILSINKDQIDIGYLMEIVKGNTIREIKRKDSQYWESNEQLIKTALHTLVDVLTTKQFLIVDFNDDNVMWDKESNTLTYIDISDNSFLRPDELQMNDSVHYAIKFMI
jgi:hypothetical protein